MAVRDILIVEDQALARMYLCACVEKCANCRVAGTLTRADAALRRCGDGHIDLILMDICTENDSDGLTAAEAIKKNYPHIKIVMVTSMLEGRFLERARRIGADSFWYKDSPSGDLVGVIDLLNSPPSSGTGLPAARWGRPVCGHGCPEWTVPAPVPRIRGPPPAACPPGYAPCSAKSRCRGR